MVQAAARSPGRSPGLLSDEDADRLEREGRPTLPTGRELAPFNRTLFVSEDELRTLAGRQQIDVRRPPELLAAANLALIAHTDPQVGREG